MLKFPACFSQTSKIRYWSGAVWAFTFGAYANDGVFLGSGNQLFPVQESQVCLKREILTIEQKGKNAFITVDFTFENPGQEKTVTVGFVSPPASGDTSDPFPRISDFNVKINKISQPWSTTTIQESSFGGLKKKSNLQSQIYYFTATFGPGETKILHTYSIKMSSSVDVEFEIPYILTTGTRWGNGQIDDFQLNILLESKASIVLPTYLSANRNTPIKWETKSANTLVTPITPFDREMVLISNHGKKLTWKTTGFKPTQELSILQLRPHLEMDFWLREPNSCSSEIVVLMREERHLFYTPHDNGQRKADLKKLSKAQLRFLRNYFYARKGFEFKNRELRKLFSNFVWYHPTKTQVALNSSELEYIELLKVVEKDK